MSKYFVFIIITVSLNAASQILMKKGMLQLGKVEFSSQSIITLIVGAATNPFVLFGLVTMATSMLTHLMSLSRFDVSFAFPFISLAYVIVLIYAHFILGENINSIRLAGMLLIVMGTVVISRS